MAEKPPKSQPKSTGPVKAPAATKTPYPEKKPPSTPVSKAAIPAAAPAPAPPPVKAPVQATAPEPVKPEPVPEPVKQIIKEEAKVEALPEAVEPAQPVAEKVQAAPEPEYNEPEPIIDPIPAAAEEGTTIMTDAIETTKKVAAEAKEKFQAAFGDFNEKAKAAVEKSSKIVEELNELTKGNVEAIVESGKIAAKGAESFGQEAAEYSRKSFEKATATLKSFASVKSPTEFFQLQSEFFSSSFDSLASEASKSSEAVLKLAGDVVQPLSTRVALVSEKVKSFTA